MRRNKWIATALSAILCLQILPAASLAATDSGAALIKIPGYQDFPAYYSDTHYADNQVTHPDVVIMDEPWNGYRYWAVYTPNVSGLSFYENPSIVASEEGVHWVEPAGLTNPIEAEPADPRTHNCDADMIYNPKMDAMMAYWNWADDQGGGVGAEVRLRISYDGIHWGVPVTYDKATQVWTAPTTPEEREVAYGETDFIPAIHSAARYDMLSPTFVYDEYRDVFVMWANNAGDVGYNNGQRNYVRIWYSNDGINWGNPVRVNNFLGTDERGRQLAPWHQDVQYIDELKEYLAASQCFSGGNPDGSVLHLTKSKDGVNWQQVGTLPLLSPGSTGNWDDFQIYRSSFYYEPGTTPGNGTMRVWYSALQKDTANKMIPDSQGNLTIQAKDRDSRIWRIGYAENNYVDMMRILLKDPTYVVPPLVTGESLTMTSDAQSGAIPAGERAKLQLTFAPANTSDQIVKYTSGNAAVATVDDFGVVTAVSIGSTNITAETREGLSATLNITVTPNSSRLIPQSSMTATATSQHTATGSEGPAANVLDGNLSTIWHTKYNPQAPLPQSLTVSFGQTRNVNKYVYTPRQTGTNGTVTEYELYAISADGAKTLIASGNWAMDGTNKTLVFDPVETTALELKVLAAGGGFGAAAEINVYEYVGDTPQPTEVFVNDRDTALTYTGDWNNDGNPAFYQGTARYTTSVDATVELTFSGTGIRWYGQNDTNFGTAKVYLDGELVETVNVNGPMATGQLLFEEMELTDTIHTIRIVCVTPVIDVDYFVYISGE